MRRFMLPGTNAQSTRLLLFNALFSIALFGLVDVLLNFYFVSLGYSKESIGILQSVPRVGGLIAAALVVPLTARMSARNVLIWTTLGMAAAQAAIVVVPTTQAIVLSRAALGLFFGIQQIAINPVAVALARPEHQTRIFAYVSMTSNVAGSIGGFLGGFMPAWIAFLFPALAVYADLPAAQTPFAYGLAIFIASVVTALSIIPILRLVVPESPRTAGTGGIAGKIPWRVLLPRGFPMLFFGVTGGLTFPFYNLFFRGVYGAPDSTVGTILSLGFFAMAFPVMFGPQLERRFGRGPALLLATGAAGMCFIGLSISPTLPTATVFFVSAISLRNIINGIYPPMLLEGLPADAHNAASSVGFLAWNIGWLAGTSMGGFIVARVGYTLMLQGVGIGVFMIGLSAWWIYRRSAAPVLLPQGGAPLPVTPSEP